MKDTAGFISTQVDAASINKADCIEMLEVAITHMRRVNELLAAIRGVSATP